MISRSAPARSPRRAATSASRTCVRCRCRWFSGSIPREKPGEQALGGGELALARARARRGRRPGGRGPRRRARSARADRSAASSCWPASAQSPWRIATRRQLLARDHLVLQLSDAPAPPPAPLERRARRRADRRRRPSTRARLCRAIAAPASWPRESYSAAPARTSPRGRQVVHPERQPAEPAVGEGEALPVAGDLRLGQHLPQRDLRLTQAAAGTGARRSGAMPAGPARRGRASHAAAPRRDP